MPDGTDAIVGEDASYGRTVHLEPWANFPDHGVEVQMSQERVVMEDHWLPMVLRFRTTSQEPQIYFEVVVPERRGMAPRLTEFAFISRDPDSPGIRQTDFREVQVKAIVEDFLSMFTFRIDRDPTGLAMGTTIAPDDPVSLRNFVGRVGRRQITSQLLERVAEVYRENIARHPTKAVQVHFQVSQRTAAGYVEQARKRGFLPKTTPGKKNA